MRNCFSIIFLPLFFWNVFFSGIRIPDSIWQAQSYPEKTIILKHPAAGNPTAYFAQTSIFTFYIFRGGTTPEKERLVKRLAKDKAVQSCSLGVLNGDFQAVEVSLKQPQSKSWFISWLKSEGLTSIKINNDPVKSLDQL